MTFDAQPDPQVPPATDYFSAGPAIVLQFSCPIEILFRAKI